MMRRPFVLLRKGLLTAGGEKAPDSKENTFRLHTTVAKSPKPSVGGAHGEALEKLR